MIRNADSATIPSMTEERMCPVCQRVTAHQDVGGFVGCVECRVRRDLLAAGPMQAAPVEHAPQEPQRVYVAYEWTLFRTMAAIGILMIAIWIIVAMASGGE